MNHLIIWYIFLRDETCTNQDNTQMDEKAKAIMQAAADNTFNDMNNLNADDDSEMQEEHVYNEEETSTETAIDSKKPNIDCHSNGTLDSKDFPKICNMTTMRQIYPTSIIQSPLSSNSSCKLTIKRINAPLAPIPPTAVASNLNTNTSVITNKTTITPIPITHQKIPADLKIEPSSTVKSNCSAAPSSTNTGTLSSSTTENKQKDHFDLFFESICASVKAMPPKLATEGKMRVMQLIGELELRAITERENSKANEGVICNGVQQTTGGSEIN